MGKGLFLQSMILRKLDITGKGYQAGGMSQVEEPICLVSAKP
jgi:hypothetical protein